MSGSQNPYVRAICHAFAILVVLSSVAAAQHVKAEPADADDIAQVADEYGIDPQDLAGAVYTTGYAPRTYLCLVDEAPCPPPPRPPIIGAVARADCIIGKESGGLDVPNRQGSGAWGPGQYFPDRWAAHTALYRAGTGYTGPLSLHSLADVERVMAYVLFAVPGERVRWSVGGC